MSDKSTFYLVREEILPEAIKKTIKVKEILKRGEIKTINEAVERMGLSRSAYYKYKEDIFPFRDNVKGKTITFVLSMDDEPGLLSLVLKKVAEFHANILTIHQTIPVNGVASLTLSVDILPSTGDSSKMIEEIEQLPGVRYLKILSRE